MRLGKLLNIILTLSLAGAFPVRVSAIPASKDTAKVRVGKWSGDFNLTSGVGFIDWSKMTMNNTRLTENGTLNLSYKKPTFQFNTSIGTGFEKNITDKTRIVLNRTFFGVIWNEEMGGSFRGR